MSIFCVVVIVTVMNIVVSDDTDNSKVDTQEKQEAYLRRYAHMSDGNVQASTRSKIGQMIDEKSEFEKAVKSFQRLAGLNETGVVDDETRRFMEMKRCGMPDNVGAGNSVRRRKRYMVEGSKWAHIALSYQIDSTTPTMTDLAVSEELAAALRYWSDVTPLIFTPVKSNPDIRISFKYRDHGDGYPFDGPGGILAHAFFPDGGSATHFDVEETWTRGTTFGTNLRQVATHELGHALGMAHSTVNPSVMAPFYQGYSPNFKLEADDIKGIQYIYGPPINNVITSSTTTTTKRASANDVTARQTVGPGRVTSTATTTTTTTVASDTPSLTTPTAAFVPPGLCFNVSIDVIVMISGITHVFQGDKYMVLDDIGVQAGYPRMIRDDWNGLPNNIDTALFTEAVSDWFFINGEYKYTVIEPARLFIFKGNQYWRYTTYQQLDNGYPKLISMGFPGIPDNLDASYIWSGNGQTYFIKNNQYYRYTRKKGVDPGYPRSLSLWVGVPSKVDSVFQYSNARTYFFRDQLYYRFNDLTMSVDDGYPRLTAQWWFGCPSSVGNIVMNERTNTDVQFKQVGGYTTTPIVNASSNTIVLSSTVVVWWLTLCLVSLVRL